MAKKATKPNHDALERYVLEIDRFADLLRENQKEITRLNADLVEKQAAFNDAKAAVREAKEVEHSTVTLLLKFITPGTHEIMPLFDTMEPADESTHGKGSTEWRKEPIAVLGLSAGALRALIGADVVLVGQLQDLMLAEGDEWYLKLEGVGIGMADAIAEKFHDFINEKCGGGK